MLEPGEGRPRPSECGPCLSSARNAVDQSKRTTRRTRGCRNLDMDRRFKGPCPSSAPSLSEPRHPGTYPCEAVASPRYTLTVRPCKDRTSGCVDGQEMLNGPDRRVGAGGSVVRGPSGYISVGYGLIELEFRKGLRISGIESGRLIESELGLGWAAGGSQERRPTGKIEADEDRADGRWIGDEGDDTHGSAARGADEREDIIDASDKGGPSRGSTAAWGGSVRRTRRGLSAELP